MLSCLNDVSIMYMWMIRTDGTVVRFIVSNIWRNNRCVLISNHMDRSTIWFIAVFRKCYVNETSLNPMMVNQTRMYLLFRVRRLSKSKKKQDCFRSNSPSNKICRITLHGAQRGILSSALSVRWSRRRDSKTVYLALLYPTSSPTSAMKSKLQYFNWNYN